MFVAKTQVSGHAAAGGIRNYSGKSHSASIAQNVDPGRSFTR